jgi:hypothetical protein
MNLDEFSTDYADLCLRSPSAYLAACYHYAEWWEFGDIYAATLAMDGIT